MASYDTVMVSLTAEVATAYVLTRTLEERIELAKSNVRFQERALRIADVKFRNGAVTELDVQQARTVLNATQASIPALETSLRQAKNALGVLLGLLPRDVDKLLADSAPVPVPPAQVSVGMPQDLIRRRPDSPELARRLTAGCRPSIDSISPNSMRNPRIFTWLSSRSRNSMLPSTK